MILDAVAKDAVEHVALGVELRRKRILVAQSLPVAVAEDVGAEPAFDVQVSRAQRRRQYRLEEGLACLPVLARDGDAEVLRQLDQRGDVGRLGGREVAIRHARAQRGVGVEHGRADRRVVGVERALEGVHARVGRRVAGPALGGGEVDHHNAIGAAFLAEAAQVVGDGGDGGAVAPLGAQVAARHTAAELGRADGGPGAHRLHRGARLVVLRGAEDVVVRRGGGQVVGAEVPPAEHEIPVVREAGRGRVAQRQSAHVVGAGAQQLDAGDGGRRHRAPQPDDGHAHAPGPGVALLHRRRHQARPPARTRLGRRAVAP